MPRPRNILFILTDQQHFRSLGCTGAPEARTPHLDALAARGTNFRNHFVTNPVCSPSRGSIMTGRHITEHGLWCNGGTLPREVPTIADVMARAGWTTAHFGKLHLIPIITRLAAHPPYGFATCEVSEGDQQLLNDSYFSWLRTTAPDLFVSYLKQSYLEDHGKGYTSVLPEELHLSTYVTRQATTFLQARRRDDPPFFLSVGFFDPHHPFNPCEPYASRFAQTEVEPARFHPDSLALRPPHYRDHHAYSQSYLAHPNALTGVRRAFHAMMNHLDTCVGRLLATLEETGLARDTAVVFTSDHGELLGHHGLLWKGPFLLDDLLRVPLLVSAPDIPEPGRATDELTSALDLFPTWQALAGIDPEKIMRASGRPFFDATLRLFPEGARDAVFAEWEGPRPAAYDSLRCVRTRDAKLVRYLHAPEQGEFYDLRADPGEFFNRHGDPACAEMQRALAARLDAEPLRPRPATPWSGGW